MKLDKVLSRKGKVNLGALATRNAPNHTPRKSARIALFARHWCGTISGTLAACRAAGVEISDESATRYLQDPRFIDYMREQQALAPGAGIWTVDELKRFLTRVAAGIEPEGHTIIFATEPIIPGESDYNEEQGGAQFRKVECRVPVYPKMADRMRAADLLGKAQGAFLDRVELSGDLKVSVVDLLDDDLKGAKTIEAKVTTCEPKAIEDDKLAALI